jgi:hypothetical protein
MRRLGALSAYIDVVERFGGCTIEAISVETNLGRQINVWGGKPDRRRILNMIDLIMFEYDAGVNGSLPPR